MSINNKDFLKDNETILWEGRPASFPIISKATSRELLIKWLLIPGCAAALIIANTSNSDHLNVMFAVELIIISVILALTPFLKKPKVMKQRYMLTDKRLLMIDNVYAYYIDRDKLTGYRVIRDQTQFPIFVFGESIYRDIKHHLLWRACADINTADLNGLEASCSAFVFYNVEQGDDLEKLLQSEKLI